MGKGLAGGSTGQSPRSCDLQKEVEGAGIFPGKEESKGQSICLQLF